MSNKFKSVEEAFSYIGSFVNFERSKKQTIRDYRLDRMRNLLKHFGNPEKTLKSIHLAGSKGKGSTAMFIASALNAAGEKTGLYSSPHISDYRERISLGGRFFKETIYIETVSEIEEGIKAFILDDETGSEEPTTFELLTLMAFMIFKKAECTWAVIETGIGGRLDATNVITPVASIITHIEMEHADILGDTIEKIAFEKAGIIKQGVPVFIGKLESKSGLVISEKADFMNAPVTCISTSVKQFDTEISESGTRVNFVDTDGKNITLNLSMIGKVQAENAILAWSALKGIVKPDISQESRIITGINNALLPGRFEIIMNNKTPFVLDGAHTPVSVNRLLDSWNSIFNRKGILLFGSVADKNPDEMARILSPHFDNTIISTPGTFKESFPEDVYEIFKKYSVNVELMKDPSDALNKALEMSDSHKPVLVTGSFYMVSEIRKLILKN